MANKNSGSKNVNSDASNGDVFSMSYDELALAAQKVLSAPFGATDAVVPELPVDPQALLSMQAEYAQRVAGLMQSGPEGPKPSSPQFKNDAWQQGPFAWTSSLYELNAEFANRMAGAMTGKSKDVERLRFGMSQMVDALSPANYLLTNPEAQKAMVETRGASLQAGIENMMHDLQKGSITQTDESAFEIGTDLAKTPGSVVYENELIQLIQYEPTTKTVGSVPMLMIPPCINKFYILDLQPENSMIRWLVDQKHTVFVVSWRNVKQDQGDLTWDDYLELGVVSAIDAVREICGVKQVNALGFCVGGTIISTALAALAARSERPVKSLTLLTTLLDFEDPGILNLFIDETQVALREANLGQGGILPGSELAQTFSALRPNDLVWNYVSRNYLQGKKPPAFDLLFWNADSTNLPGPTYAWYLRHMYLQNELCVPDKLTCLGEQIDLGRLDMPIFLYGSKEDHIVPWEGAYASRQALGANTHFVLGASGHIAGVINPPAKNKRHYWTSDSESPDAGEWFEQAEQCTGSWWTHWGQWLKPKLGKMVSAPKAMGSAEHLPIEPAPGRYVRERAV